MPCYEVRTTTFDLKLANLDVLRKALAALKFEILYETNGRLKIDSLNTGIMTIDTAAGTIQTSLGIDSTRNISNQIKRAYSNQVIDQVAARGKWFKKTMTPSKVVLTRY